MQQGQAREFPPARFARRVDFLKDFAFANDPRARDRRYISTGGGGLFYRKSDSPEDDAERVPPPPPLTPPPQQRASRFAVDFPKDLHLRKGQNHFPPARFARRVDFLKDSAFVTMSKSQNSPGALRAPGRIP